LAGLRHGAGLIRPAPTLPAAKLPGLVKPPVPTPPLGLSKAGATAPVGMSKAVGAVPALAPGLAVVPAAAAAPAPCTVYVGRISSEVSDDFVRQLLEKCGTVTKWNRAADPNTSKLTSFGFCDFETPQGVWRALEYLHEKQLCDKRLLVKCEEKAKQTIEEWKDTRRSELAAAAPKDEDDPPKPLTDEQMHEQLAKESEEVAEAIQKLLAEKNKGFPELSGDADEKEEEKAADEAKDKGADDGKAKEDGKDDKAQENGKATKDRSRSRSRGKRMTRSEERRKERELEKEREKKAAVSKYFRPSRREREREQRVRDRERDIDKEYGYRLREMERGEEHRIKNLKRDFRDLEWSEPTERERRKFIEQDMNFGKRESEERDWKRYREDRTRERQKEKEKDNADRALVAKEEEAEKLKKKQEEEERRRQKEEEERKRQEEIEEQARLKREAEEKERRTKEMEELLKKRAEDIARQQAAAKKLLDVIREELRHFKVEAARKEPDVTGSIDGPGGRDERRKSGGGAGGEKLRDDEMRRLIQQVPTEKAKAFAFEIDWDVVHDNQIIEKKLRPWVRKKVTEYLGSEEQGMIDFIMRKVSGQAPPATILAELEGFLDEEAENFTLKMWRMLIFEVLRVKAR